MPVNRDFVRLKRIKGTPLVGCCHVSFGLTGWCAFVWGQSRSSPSSLLLAVIMAQASHSGKEAAIRRSRPIPAWAESRDPIIAVCEKRQELFDMGGDTLMP
jgi:hypothetical protein